MNTSFYEYLPDIFVLVSLGGLAFFLLLRHFTLISLAASGDFDKVSKMRVSNLAVAMLLLSIAMVFLFMRAIVTSAYLRPGFAIMIAVALFILAIFFNAGIMYLGLRQILRRRNEQ